MPQKANNCVTLEAAKQDAEMRYLHEEMHISEERIGELYGGICSQRVSHRIRRAGGKPRIVVRETVKDEEFQQILIRPDVSSWKKAGEVTHHGRKTLQAEGRKSRRAEMTERVFLERRKKARDAKGQSAIQITIEELRIVALKKGCTPNTTFIRQQNSGLCKRIYKYIGRVKVAWERAGLSPKAGDPLPDWMEALK